MLKYYLKLALRNLQGNKFTKGVKIGGMALAIAVSMIIFLYVNHEMNYDRFFSNYKNVYRILNDVEQFDGINETTSYTPNPLAPTIKENFPEIVSACRVDYRQISVRFFYDESYFDTNSMANADSNYFDIFNVEFIYGSKENVLESRYNIAISESFSKKLFGNENPIGKIILLENNYPLTVTAVYKDFPTNASNRPEYVRNEPELKNFYKYQFWEYHWIQTYVLLNPSTDIHLLAEKINNLVRDKVKTRPKDKSWTLWFQPVTEIHTTVAGEATVPKISLKQIRLLQLIAFIILLVAWLNHINISVNLRLKQIQKNSIDKVFGMNPRQQFNMLLTETLSEILIALIAAIFLLLLFLPQIYQVTGKEINLFDKWELWVLFTAGLLAISLLTSQIEVYLVSRINFTIALKGQLGKKRSGKQIKQAVLITQYIVSVILIFFTTIAFMQTRYLINRDLGLDTENILIIISKALSPKHLPDALIKKQVLLNEISKFPEVRSATYTNTVPTRSAFGPIEVCLPGEDKSSFWVQRCRTDSNYFKTFNIPLIAGDKFRHQNDETEIKDVVITKSMVNHLGFSNLHEALNKTLLVGVGGVKKNTFVIKGIVKDVFLNNLYDRKSKYGVVFFYWSGKNEYLAIKFNAPNYLSFVNKIQDTWKEVTQQPAARYFLLNDSNRMIYESELKQRKIFLLFTLTAILIACFGLFAMAFETIVQRTKEVGIRKVNGAKIQDILQLLFSDYFKIIAFAILPGLLIAYFLTTRWLEDFVNKISISWYYFIFPVILLVIVTVISVMYHSYKAAVSNPVEALKYE